MKRRVLLVISVLLILAGIFLLVRIAASTITPKGKGGLQVTSNIKSTVFLNNKAIGNTPLCKCENETIQSGEYELRIVPDDKTMQPFTNRIKVNPGVLTAVERTFFPGALASSYVLTLEKTKSTNAEVFIASIPDGALVSIDGESRGVTPLSINSISASEHEIEIQKQGFGKKTVRVRAVPSYKLVLNLVLGTDSGTDDTEITVPTQTPAPSTSPTPTGDTVTIKSTPTGFLRVRETASTGAKEIGRVEPEKTYKLLDENTSWYQIELETGIEGWVSKQYAEKTTQ